MADKTITGVIAGVIAGVEAGGTKFVCGVGTCPADLERQEFATTTPEETLPQVVSFLARFQLDALGIGCFGPLDLAQGRITSTPKEAWRNVNIVNRLQSATGIPRVVLDTDVNAAAMGEHTWGAARGLDTFLYLTVGTGIGGGAMVNGRLLHGLSHPEMGHVRISHDLAKDPFTGDCYAHGDCLEGLASGRAMERRWGARAETLAEGHPAWQLEAHYLGLGITSLICAFSPQKVIVGGGVMKRVGFDAVRAQVRQMMNGYMEVPEIVPPELGNDAGVLGAIALARQ
jgi:fructokinase